MKHGTLAGLYLLTFFNDTVKENILPCLRKQSKIDAYFSKPEFTGPEKHLNFFLCKTSFLSPIGWTEVEYVSKLMNIGQVLARG